MIVALVVVVVAALATVCYVLRECDKRCKRLEIQLFAALGRTEMIAITAADERPRAVINYATPTDDEQRRERMKLYPNAS